MILQSGVEISRIEQHLQKQEIVNLISSMALSNKTYELSNGSSIPKRFFADLERRFGIPISKNMDSKAAMICSYYGIEWTADCDSSESPSGGGGTVTKQGLLHLLAATKKALAQEIKE